MIAVVDFGMGNIHSCLKAVSLFTGDFQLITDPNDLKKAKGAILPGDGAFQKAMENLDGSGFTQALGEFVSSGKPLFGICIGYQLLFEDSDEAKDRGKIINGLGFIKGHVRKFNGKKNFKVPHMGWNKIYFSKQKKLLAKVASPSYMYFIHSYRPVAVEQSAVAATCSYYEEKFPVVVEKENVFGTQFHPEKSDRSGLKILENFIQLAGSC
jgi:imidazole glycerol-phosphate synthase subunit HisH